MTFVSYMTRIWNIIILQKKKTFCTFFVRSKLVKPSVLRQSQFLSSFANSEFYQLTLLFYFRSNYRKVCLFSVSVSFSCFLFHCTLFNSNTHVRHHFPPFQRFYKKLQRKKANILGSIISAEMAEY